MPHPRAYYSGATSVGLIDDATCAHFCGQIVRKGTCTRTFRVAARVVPPHIIHECFCCNRGAAVIAREASFVKRRTERVHLYRRIECVSRGIHRPAISRRTVINNAGWALPNNHVGQATGSLSDAHARALHPGVALPMW